MCLSCTVYNGELFVESRRFSPMHLHLALPLGDYCVRFRRPSTSENQSFRAIVRHSLHDPMSIRLYTIPACDGRTDGRTL